MLEENKEIKFNETLEIEDLQIVNYYSFKRQKKHLFNQIIFISMSLLIIGLAIYNKDILEELDLKSLLENDLEQIVFSKYPQILNLKKQLLEYSSNVLMSGSGSTIYVIDELKTLKKIYKEIKKIYPEYKYVLTKTR